MCCQTEEGVFLLKDDYDMLVKKASCYIDFKDELSLIRNYFANAPVQDVEMDAYAFKELCVDIGASKLFHTICSAMCMETMSNERRALNETRTIVIICIMLFSLPQKSNWFRVALSRTLRQFGISEQGLASLRNLGIAAHPQTERLLQDHRQLHI